MAYNLEGPLRPGAEEQSCSQRGGTMTAQLGKNHKRQVGKGGSGGRCGFSGDGGTMDVRSIDDIVQAARRQRRAKKGGVGVGEEREWCPM